VAGRPAVERLVELLAADDAELADAAGRALAGARGAVPAVAEMLDAPDPLLRSRAVRILGLSGDPAAIEVLLAAHARGDAEQRREAAAGLVRLGYGATRG
jgi:HEAT repeat protein